MRGDEDGEGERWGTDVGVGHENVKMTVEEGRGDRRQWKD